MKNQIMERRKEKEKKEIYIFVDTLLFIGQIFEDKMPKIESVWRSHHVFLINI